jgi:hypothetical protein
LGQRRRRTIEIRDLTPDIGASDCFEEQIDAPARSALPRSALVSGWRHMAQTFESFIGSLSGSADRLARLRRLAWLIDGVFRLPGSRFRFGLNSLIGLLPVGGDALLGLISLYIIYEAHRMGVPKPKLARMLANVGIEVLGGSVPIVGDLFDMTLKANLRNLRIIEEHFGIRF